SRAGVPLKRSVSHKSPMRKQLSIVAVLLVALLSMAGPLLAGAARIDDAAAVVAASQVMCREAFEKPLAFKPCGKKLNGKAVLPCHLPAAIAPTAIEPAFCSGAVVFETSIPLTPASPDPAGHFRPPRSARA